MGERTKKIKKAKAAALAGAGPSPIERIQILENVVMGLQQVLTNMSKGIDALTALAGSDKVQAEVDRAHCARQEAEIAESVRDGFLVVAEKPGEASVVVGTLTQDGVVQRPGVFFGEVAKMGDDFRSEIVGQDLPVEVTREGTVLRVERAYDRTEKAKEGA